MRFTRFCLIGLAICFGLVSASNATRQNKSESVETGSVPKWVHEYFSFRTRGTGRWVTDNSRYKSANEPFEEYATEWTWSAGKQSIKGRLYGLIDKKEAGTFVEFRMHWHPGERKVVTQAFGAAGTYAIGELKPGESKSEITIEHTVYTPDGGSYRELIKENDGANEFHTEDFIWKDGKWQTQRSYVWRAVPASNASRQGTQFTNDPSKAGLIFDDVRNFLNAYKLVQEGADPVQTFRQGYIDIGSLGLKAYFQRQNLTAEIIAESARNRPALYGTLTDLLPQLQQQELGIRKALAGFKELYADVVYPPFYSEKPQDLGYFIGYKIVESFYRNAADKKKAILEILSVTDFHTFFERSGYAKKFAEFKE